MLANTICLVAQSQTLMAGGLLLVSLSYSGEFPFRLLFSQYLFQIPCTRFYKCHNLQVLQHLELKFGLWKEKTLIHVRFLLVAVIIQDIGLLLDSNNSGELNTES